MKTITYDDTLYQLVPKAPTPEMIAAAAIAVLPIPSGADFDLARQAARIVLAHPNSPPMTDLEFIAAAMATIIPAHRAMISAAPTPPAQPVKPLTEEQIAEACGWEKGRGCKPLLVELRIARAIEAAHGIKE